jgi:hypothetical protein
MLNNPMKSHPVIKQKVKDLKKAKNLIEMLPSILNLHASIHLTSRDDFIKNMVKHQYLEALLSHNISDEVKDLLIKILDMPVPRLYEYLAEVDIPQYARDKFLSDMDRLYGITKN